MEEAERIRQLHAEMYPGYKYQPRRKIKPQQPTLGVPGSPMVHKLHNKHLSLSSMLPGKGDFRHSSGTKMSQYQGFMDSVRMNGSYSSRIPEPAENRLVNPKQPITSQYTAPTWQVPTQSAQYQPEYFRGAPTYQGVPTNFTSYLPTNYALPGQYQENSYPRNIPASFNSSDRAGVLHALAGFPASYLTPVASPDTSVSLENDAKADGLYVQKSWLMQGNEVQPGSIHEKMDQLGNTKYGPIAPKPDEMQSPHTSLPPTPEQSPAYAIKRNDNYFSFETRQDPNTQHLLSGSSTNENGSIPSFDPNGFKPDIIDEQGLSNNETNMAPVAQQEILNSKQHSNSAMIPPYLKGKSFEYGTQNNLHLSNGDMNNGYAFPKKMSTGFEGQRPFIEHADFDRYIDCIPGQVDKNEMMSNFRTFVESLAPQGEN